MLSSAPKKRALKTQIEGEEDEEQEQITAAAERISNQIGIIEGILSTVPVKTLFKLRCVSKPWLSLISEPSFIKGYNTHGTRHGLFIVADDRSTSDRYVLFAGHNGGAITHLLSLPNSGGFPSFKTEVQNVNGLFLFTPYNSFDERNFAIAFNPSTRKIFKLPGGAYDPRGRTHNLYFLGFNESRREHKILNIKTVDVKSGLKFVATEYEFKVFSLSNCSWRKIDAEFPLHPNETNYHYRDIESVCVNNVMHFVIHDKGKIMGFDLQTEKFSVMDAPAGVDCPSLRTINGSLGVSSRKYMGNPKNLDVWILKDYKNQVWVKGQPYNFPDVVFIERRLSPDVLSIRKYNVKKLYWKSVEVNISHEVLCSETLDVGEVGSYVECIVPLKNSPELLPLLHGRAGGKNVLQISEELKTKGLCDGVIND